jgi:hypothetical protein
LFTVIKRVEYAIEFPHFHREVLSLTNASNRLRANSMSGCEVRGVFF